MVLYNFIELEKDPDPDPVENFRIRILQKGPDRTGSGFATLQEYPKGGKISKKIFCKKCV